MDDGWSRWRPPEAEASAGKLPSLHIFNLPDNVLVDAAAYLPKPSRAMVAVAMTATPSSWAKLNSRQLQQQPSTISGAILSSSFELWEALDFEDIEQDLASKLSDDDIAAILTCTNAVSNLKRLKLTGCVNITGIGLEHLRGSVSLEQIDLSLAKQHETPVIKLEPCISEDMVLPILDSIVDADGNSLKHLQLPEKWRNKHHRMLSEFLERYNQLLESRGSTCSDCNVLVESGCYGRISRNEGQRVYGLQYNTCYKCVKQFCCAGNEDQCYVKFCNRCQRDFCFGCDSENGWCDICHDEDFCSGCAMLKECQDCHKNFCLDCVSVTKCACLADGVSCNQCIPDDFLCECA